VAVGVPPDGADPGVAGYRTAVVDGHGGARPDGQVLQRRDLAVPVPAHGVRRGYVAVGVTDDRAISLIATADECDIPGNEPRSMMQGAAAAGAGAGTGITAVCNAISASRKRGRTSARKSSTSDTTRATVSGHGGVVDPHAALDQQLLNVPIGQVEPQVPAHGDDDDLWREPKPGERRLRRQPRIRSGR
jgi:hypothetical protein